MTSTYAERIALPCLLCLALAACGDAGTVVRPEGAAAPAQTPDEFVERINEELREIGDEVETANWVRATYITKDTGELAARASERYAEFHSKAVQRAQRHAGEDMAPETARAIKLLTLGTVEPAPDDPEKRRRLAAVTTGMAGAYGEGKYCPEDAAECLALGDLEDIMASSHDYDANLAAWTGWRTVSPPMRDDYETFVEITNEGARELGFEDLGDMWKSGYDMSPAEFEEEAARLWSQVEPLYEELHCYVRRELAEHYGEDKVALDEPIPAHLLGNMWAQQWGNVYELVEPYPGVASLDVDAALVEQQWSPVRMVETAEDFFVSLGLPELPETFYERSMLTKPRDREVVCHASAWAMDWGEDPRIKMCIKPTYDELATIYHELGHIYYYLAYKHQPPIFHGGAHDGFHEGIGDTVVLSLTPAFLNGLGLVEAPPDSEEAVINTQMKMALDKIAFLPFGKLIDEWRWRVFSGEIAPENYNSGWWELRTRYQGIAPPVPRSEEDFDPGAKYHIPANTPYTRYFLAHILQFQFQRALCEAAGHEGPLHECSIYGSAEAGEKLEAMLAAGSSEPWQDTLEKLTGTREMDASAISEYFAPLMAWLEARNEGTTCGW